MPDCVLLTWMAHAPPVCVHVFGRKSALPNSLRAYSASRCRLPSLPAQVGLVGSFQPACWEARKAGSPGPGGAVAPTPAFLFLLDSPPAAGTKTTFNVSSQGENEKHMTLFWLVHMKFLLTFRNMPQNQLFIPEVFFVILNGKLCCLDSHKTTVVAYFWFNIPQWKLSKKVCVFFFPESKSFFFFFYHRKNPACTVFFCLPVQSC